MTEETPNVNAVFERFADRWLELGDRLLAPGRHVNFADSVPERNFRLLQGYKRAGDILVQNAFSEPYDRNNLIFPTLFLYRHYIELALKKIIEDHGSFANVSLGSKGHNLIELWGLFLNIGTAFGYDGSEDVAISVGECIREFAMIDASSTVFRYSSNKRGSLHSLPLDGLNIVGLHNIMNGIEMFFECADLDFTDKAERAAEFSWHQENQ